MSKFSIGDIVIIKKEKYYNYMIGSIGIVTNSDNHTIHPYTIDFIKLNHKNVLLFVPKRYDEEELELFIDTKPLLEEIIDEEDNS